MADMKTHTETITTTNHAYTISLGGTLDGENTRDPVGYSPYAQAYEPNRYVRIENTGKTPIVNPWIIVNGKRNWRSIDHIQREIIHPDMSDAEKAIAIYDFARAHRYHYTCADDEVKDTVKMLNGYGYTLCWDEAYTVSNLWQAAGLSIRRGYPHGHCTTEVYFDGAFHLLDSDEHLCYLLRDNRTIASEEDLSRDHDLVKRGHAYGILQPENRHTSEGAASLFFYTGPRTGTRPQLNAHTMNFTLRPGEALVWAWEDRGKYHGHGDRPKRLSNGYMHYAPELTDLHSTAHNDGWISDGTGCRPGISGREAVLIFDIHSPYVIVGGALDLTCTRGPQDRLHIDLSRDAHTYEPLPLQNGPIDLDPHFPPNAPATYTYRIRMRATGNSDTLAIKHLAIHTDLQMAPLSLPALELGANAICYTADTAGHVRITHAYEERIADPAPEPPKKPLYPGPNACVPGTQFTFSWQPVETATDYHFQLSDRADMKRALSPVFDKLISRTPSKGNAEWHIPHEGLLNPDQTYYWRIRPRNADGLWGTWSPTWAFTPQAPGVPQHLEIIPDHPHRTLTLRWQPNPDGNPPDHYEVYGSDERGFTISRTPYPVVIGQNKTEIFPANILFTTRQTTAQVADPTIAHGNKAFYRIVAVDKTGIRSGPSDLIGAPRPMIVSKPAERAIAGKTYTYQIKAIAAIGELRCESDGPQRYRSAFRDGDTLRFLLDEGPPWIYLHERTGLLTAHPQATDAGTHTVTVRVQNGQGGMDMQGFDLRVTAS